MTDPLAQVRAPRNRVRPGPRSGRSRRAGSGAVRCATLFHSVGLPDCRVSGIPARGLGVYCTLLVEQHRTVTTWYLPTFSGFVISASIVCNSRLGSRLVPRTTAGQTSLHPSCLAAQPSAARSGRRPAASSSIPCESQAGALHSFCPAALHTRAWRSTPGTRSTAALQLVYYVHICACSLHNKNEPLHQLSSITSEASRCQLCGLPWVGRV